MRDDMLEEMAAALSNELHVSSPEALAVLSRYWQDKIAHVWSVEDVYECAHRAEQPVTREGAITLLGEVFNCLDSDHGISWTNIEAALEDFHLDFEFMPEEKYADVYGVFCVWRQGDAFNHQFGFFPGKAKENLPEALAFAKKLAREVPGVPVFLACELQTTDELQPWLAVIAHDGQSEPTITEGECHVRMD